MWRVTNKKILQGISILLTVTLFLGGCQSADQEEENQAFLAVGEEEGPVKEYVIPDWEPFMYELTGTDKINAQDAPVFCQSSISQMVLVRGESLNDYRAYWLVFSLESKQWTAISMQDDFERDGIHYGWIGGTFPSLDGDQYCFTYIEAGRAQLAAFGPGGVGEIDAGREWTDQKQGDHILLDASGDLVSYQNNGYRYDMEGNYFADVYFYNDRLEEQSQRKITGWVLGGMQADDQSPFYLYGYDEEQQPCLWDTDGSKQLLQGAKELDYQAAYAEGGILCFTDRSGIWEMDGESAREIYHYTDHGYYPDTIYGMCRGEGQTLQILMECQGELLVLAFDLSRKDVVIDKQDLTLALSMRNVGLEAVIARFNRQSSRYRVKVIFPGQEENAEDFCRKIQMELAAGRGPDLLGSDVFSSFEAMVDSGYLECLDGQDFEKLGCIDTALETNRVRQKLYGIPYDFSLDIAAYRTADLAGAESLTLEEFMARVRNSQAEILQKWLYPDLIVIKYALSDSSNKAYIDWEAGESHLEEKPFLELLEFAREYGYRGNTVESSRIFAAPSFNYYDPGIYGLSGLTYIYECLGTMDVTVLGYPREEGYGIYMDTRSICINSQSEGKKGAMEFLRYLISDQAQTVYVNHDMMKDLHSAGGFLAATDAQFPVNRVTLENLMDKELGEKPDDQWIEEAYRSSAYAGTQREQYTFLVENAQPPLDLGGLTAIVQEELAPFFDGSRTAQEAARILDSRVQLYLDERK